MGWCMPMEYGLMVEQLKYEKIGQRVVVNNWRKKTLILLFVLNSFLRFISGIIYSKTDFLDDHYSIISSLM